MEIKSLAGTNFDTIYKAFSQAFAEYEVQQNKEQLWRMLKRRGFDSGLSFAAFDEGNIVAFTLNGIGCYNGIKTAYDTGTGTLKDYRGKGLATEIFEYSIPYLKEANTGRYLLEVLQHNTKAVSVYSNLGFKVNREFNYFIQDKEEAGCIKENSHMPYYVKKIDIRGYDCIPDFWDFHPSWQNSFQAVEQVPEHFINMGIFIENKIIGYCIFEPDSGDITQIAVHKDYRRKGVGTMLFENVIKLNKSNVIKIINTDISCNTITGFLQAKNINITGKQFEMIKEL